MARKPRKGNSRSTLSLLTFEDGSLVPMPWPNDLSRPNWTIAISGRPSTRELWAGRVIDKIGNGSLVYMEDATFGVGAGMTYSTAFAGIENVGILYSRLINSELSRDMVVALDIPEDLLNAGHSKRKTEGTIARDVLLGDPAAFTDSLQHGPDKLANIDVVVYEALQQYTKDKDFIEAFSGMPIALVRPKVKAIEAEEGWIVAGHPGGA